MKKLLFNLGFGLFFMAFGHGQQQVFSRGEVSTGNWGDGQLPWFYQSDNNSQGDPDNGNTIANLIRIGHNNNTTMTLNGRTYRAREIIFQSAATSNRTFQGQLLDLRYQNGGPSKIENQGTGSHTFNNEIAILDGVSQFNPVNGDLTFTNNIFNNGNFIDVFGNNGNKLVLSGNLQGAGGIALKQNSIVEIAGDMTYTGGTAIEGGTLRLVAGGDLSNDTPVTISLGAIFDLNNQDVTVRSVSETANANGGIITLGSGTLTINGDYTGNRFQNSILGTGNIVKNGTGSVSFYGSQTYSGTTTVNDGTLSTSVDLASSEVIVNASGTFSIPSSQEVTIQDLTLASGATINLDSGAILNVTGAFVDNGFTLTGGGELRIIRSTSADGNWALSSTWLNNLTPSNTEFDFITINHNVNLDTGLSLNGYLEISTGNTLTVNSDAVLTNNGSINVDGDLVFKSTSATATAQYGNSTGSIIGDVSVERYIPARRAFRFLSSAVSGQSIADAWQQSTHITGTGGATNGFDPSSSNNPSMFTFDASAQSWLPVSTTSTDLEAGTAYRIMVRGDRTIDLLDANANDETPNVTTLVATGNLATGDLTTGVDLPQLSQDASTTSPTEETKFSFVGNPYQAVVDASLLTYNGGVRSDFIVFWDPNLGDKGAFVQVELSTGSIILPTPAPTPSSTAASKFIMPGQAFFVGNASSVTTPSITFTEAAKATLQTQTSVFSTTSLAYLNLRLYTQSAWSNNQPEQDALGIRWSSEYTTDVSIEDIVKLGNPDENIAVNNSNILLGIDKRNLPTSEEIIPLFINNYEQEDYVIFNQHENLPEGANLYLEDHYLETSTLLENDEVYEFNVDATIPASKANNRFTIRYEVGTLSQTDFTENSFSMYPNPVQDELNIQWNSIQNEDTQFTIFNIVGKKIAEFIQNASSEVNSIPVYNLEAGVYLLKIQNQEINATKKFIKR